MALNTDREKGAHLLRRFGLGASEAELDYYMADGLAGAVDKLLAYESVEEGFDLSPDDFVNKKGKVQMPQLVAWWTTRLLQTRRPLQEKMTLFWHNHFATGADKVKASGMMFAQNQTLRQNATGNFRTLLHAVSKDPAMIFWLDNESNVVGKPNENFAREVMELFTLGIGNYTEKDIQQSARAYTGWSLRRVRDPQALMPMAEFFFRPRMHDETDKTFFGQTGNFDGDQILDMLCDNPRSSEFIVETMLKFFVYDKPEQSLVSSLTEIFRNNNLELKPLLKAIMLSPEFYSAKAERAIFKTPCDFVVTTARQLGFGELIRVPDHQTGAPPVYLGPVATVALEMKNQGMEPFYPPDVAGWRLGANWISSATMVSRIGWADSIFGTASGKRARMNIDVSGLFGDNATSEVVVDKLVSLFDAPLPANKIAELKMAADKASGGQVGPQIAAKTAAAVAQLIFASPEFQFA